MTMTAPRKIMLATDLTPAGDRAFDRAVELAQEWDADLIVLHVVESNAARPWGIDRRMHNAETEMDRLVRSARQACRIVRHTVIGDPADRTLAHADRAELERSQRRAQHRCCRSGRTRKSG